MKRLFFLLAFGIVAQSFAVSNLKINGQKEFTITSIPTHVTLTADLAASGNEVEVTIYLDTNMSKTLDVHDIPMDFNVFTDGIGWIRDSQSPDEDIPGDESPVDGKIRSTMEFEEQGTFPSNLAAIIQAKEKDGSSDIAVLEISVQPKPPYIKGKVTDANTGIGIPMVLVGADLDDESGITVTDNDGNYFINLSPGTWQVYAADFFQQKYGPSDTLGITLDSNSAIIQDFALTPYTSFINGSVKKEDGSGVPDITLYAINQILGDMSFDATDANGDYRVGVLPGTVIIGPLPFSDDIPEGFYLDPTIDTLSVGAGETKTANFTLMQYKAFISGTCTSDGQPLAGVEITAMNIDFVSGVFDVSRTMSKADGSYKVGVMPGTILSLNAQKEGYQITFPSFGYQNIPVNDGQTITGKDFQLSLAGEIAGISGRVTFANGSPATGVYVAAINDDYESRQGFLITYTNNNGEYVFDGLDFGEWQVGVFKANYGSNPEMRYESVYGLAVTNADFVLVATTDVASQPTNLPMQFYLGQNYPNPFRINAGYKSTTFHVNLDQLESVNVAIYNINGQLIKSIHTGLLNSGLHLFQWDGRDDAGGFVPSGVYFYKAISEDQQMVNRMMILR